MAHNIGIFDTSIGIQNVLQDETNNVGMPTAKQLAANLMAGIGLEELYLPKNAALMIEDALLPAVGDGKVLRPDIFAANLRGIQSALENSRNEDIRAFVRKDLAAILEDNALLQAYAGLMVGG